jgi:aspartate-semialdehyde dehydrogenase
MRVAVIGATGLVGHEMLAVLEEFRFPVTELIPAASEQSAGKLLSFAGKEYTVVTVGQALALKPDLALFSAGSATSREWAQRFVQAGALVVDNSSAWRMEADVPLVVPEVNLAAVGASRLIANPNCSTIQMVVALQPLQVRYGLKRVVVSTYQSVSGTGKAAVDQMLRERKGEDGAQVYPHAIDRNILPHIDTFQPNDYTREEMKMLNETRKIMGLPNLRLTATTVRVPVLRGHSESVNVELERPFELTEVRELLKASQGIVVQDDWAENLYPMPRYLEGRNEVFVGRIRRDESVENGLNLWIVADNLRKGAATNAVQIAQDVLL